MPKKKVRVKPYTRKDGTRVKGHLREVSQKKSVDKMSDEVNKLKCPNCGSSQYNRTDLGHRVYYYCPNCGHSNTFKSY